MCFWLNRREAWCSQSKNILSIIIVDMLDGLSTMTWFFVSFKADIDRSVCLTSTALSMATHSAASLNILRVCVTRLRSVRSTSVTHEQSTSKIMHDHACMVMYKSYNLFSSLWKSSCYKNSTGKLEIL